MSSLAEATVLDTFVLGLICVTLAGTGRPRPVKVDAAMGLVAVAAVSDTVAVHRGPGRVLALANGLFTLAAGARSGVQLSQHPHDGLFAYVLAAVSASIYASGAVLMVYADGGRLRRLALASCLVELTGVLVVGTLSVVRSEWFGEASVWSGEAMPAVSFVRSAAHGRTRAASWLSSGSRTSKTHREPCLLDQSGPAR